MTSGDDPADAGRDEANAEPLKADNARPDDARPDDEHAGEARDPEERVFVVDDDDAVRASLTLVLTVEGFAVETFSDGPAFLARCADGARGCVIMDLHMPSMNGLDVQRRMAASDITLPIIFLSGHGSVVATVSALRGGAVDFLEKPWSGEILLNRIDEALRSDRRQRAERKRWAALRKRLDTLTPREVEVLGHVTRGIASKVIAAELAISERTVELHRARVMKKLGFRTLGELMRDMLDFGAHDSGGHDSGGHAPGGHAPGAHDPRP